MTIRINGVDVGSATSLRLDGRDQLLRQRTDPERRLTAIGDVAREFGVTLRALRFYEDRGLLKPLRQGAARLYRAEDKRRLTLILTGKKLGFTLTQIRDLLETGATSDAAAANEDAFERALTPQQVVEQLDALERQREELEGAIARLKAARESIGAAA